MVGLVNNFAVGCYFLITIWMNACSREKGFPNSNFAEWIRRPAWDQQGHSLFYGESRRLFTSFTNCGNWFVLCFRVKNEKMCEELCSSTFQLCKPTILQYILEMDFFIFPEKQQHFFLTYFWICSILHSVLTKNDLKRKMKNYMFFKVPVLTKMIYS